MARTKKNTGGRQSRKGSKRWRLCLSKTDFEALRFFEERYLFESLVNGIRFSLRRQVEIDEGEVGSARDAARAKRIRGTVTGMLIKSREYGSDEERLIQWSCWLSDEDRDNIHKIMRAHDLTHLVEAIRFGIRMQAERDGFKPESGVW